MNKAQELSIGMFVTNNDKDLPIKGKILKFTDDGKAVVKKLCRWHRICYDETRV